MRSSFDDFREIQEAVDRDLHRTINAFLGTPTGKKMTAIETTAHEVTDRKEMTP